jgi:glyoxylase-like metal-dependent hydrolase (beta-lactamase superfamily II)
MKRAVLAALLAAAATYAPSVYAQSSADSEVHILKVQGNVYMLVGAGGNITAQVGKDGIFLVDSGNGKMNDKVQAALKTLSDKPIHYIVNTSFDSNLTGGNAGLASTGAPVLGGNLGNSNRGAAIVASENVVTRLSAPAGPKVAPEALPTVTFFEGDKEIFFNSEPVITMLAPAAHSDGDTIVFFRRSDVVSTGEVFNTYTYPVINLEAGGSINGVIDALNHVLDIAVPEHEQEGGTYIIPGRGRLCDEHDVLEYRDMVTIIRDRVQYGIKHDMTLDQIKAAGYTKEYDPRWGGKGGEWTTDKFIEAVYKSLKK